MTVIGAARSSNLTMETVCKHQDPLASGSFPLLLQNSGKFQRPGAAGTKSYDFVLTPQQFTLQRRGSQLRGK